MYDHITSSYLLARLKLMWHITH